MVQLDLQSLLLHNPEESGIALFDELLRRAQPDATAATTASGSDLPEDISSSAEAFAGDGDGDAAAQLERMQTWLQHMRGVSRRELEQHLAHHEASLAAHEDRLLDATCKDIAVFLQQDRMLDLVAETLRSTMAAQLQCFTHSLTEAVESSVALEHSAAPARGVQLRASDPDLSSCS